MDKSIVAWFKSLDLWISNNSNWLKDRHNDNDITSAVDVLLYDIALFAGDTKAEKDIYSIFSVQRLYKQIKEESKQLAELKRTKTIAYSVYNLSHFIDFCLLTESNRHSFSMIKKNIFCISVFN
jgi:hypothetical protein